MLAATTDIFLEGTHFRPDDDPWAVGWKAAAANLSDLAATGCRARWLLAAAGVRRDTGEEWLRRAAEGLLACAREFGAALVGGDTTSGNGPTSICVTALGTPLPGAPLLRSGARAGDVVAVTGAFGGSLLGRHLRPVPRLREIAALLAASEAMGGGVVTAAMDVSDGLALDLSRLCRESGCGAEVDAAAIPVHPDAATLAETSERESALHHALGDGEDFELLVTVRPADWDALLARYAEARGRNPSLAPLAKVGICVEDRGLRLRTEEGGVIPLAPLGYEHDFA